jgi:hypothetical protein
MAGIALQFRAGERKRHPRHMAAMPWCAQAFCLRYGLAWRLMPR